MPSVAHLEVLVVAERARQSVILGDLVIFLVGVGCLISTSISQPELTLAFGGGIIGARNVRVDRRVGVIHRQVSI